MKELMELNVAAYPGLIRGAAAWSEDELGWIPVRMTPQLLDFYHDNENAAIRAACPSGIRIAFRSNSEALAMRWIINAARSRSGKSMSEKLADELLDAFNSTGSAFKKKEDTHRMAEANKAFSHFRF